MGLSHVFTGMDNFCRLLSNGDECIEYLENAIELLSYLTYYPSVLHERLWEILGPLIVAMNDWGYDYMMDITGPIMNYIAKVRRGRTRLPD